MSKAKQSWRLAAARNALGHAHNELGLGFGFELWDGTLVPEDLGADDLRIFISSSAVVSRLIRSPRVATVIALYVDGHIDIRGGTLFDIIGRRPKVRTREFRRRLKKGLLLKSALPFMFGSGALKQSPDRAIDGGRDATKSRGSNKADIAFHYDVGNAFYRLFLDPEMVYTCGYFRQWSNDLATAQRDKLDLVCRKLRLKPGDRLLDIGSGWGALICHAAQNYGVTALGVTLSEEQAELAWQTIAARGLEGQVEVEIRDFRDVEGQFDKIASIGMFEHIGIDNHESYYRNVHKLLKDRGLYLHHAITRRGKGSERAFRRKRPEYRSMVRYIFPGAEVDHIGMTARSLEAYGFEVHDVEGLREHYARTTRIWAHNLMANADAAIAEVGAPRYRMWVAYLSGVSLAFDRGTLSIFQTLASKRNRGASGLPPTREDLYS
ncbi:Cyclopropane-fatty-acyl-phospholipid synthase [hydrothermal vent metagenome]|uniref:Cyclopropane-fatty-acyl-phospholipid synthase n=1 Tax=hydrothermal vent metagenome TaxID=652676 RepID=A0A3B0SWY2_9ZZZZ